MPPVIRAYDIDLSKPPGERWAAMIQAERDYARALITNCNKHALSFIEWAGKIGNMGFTAFKSAVAGIYKIGGRAYGEDVDVWAKGIGVPRRDIIFANLQYEICQAFGCTSLAYNLPDGRGVAHVRNMDWPLIGCGPITCLMNYHGKCGPFTTVGWPCYIGVLSAMAPGRFSATINQAPQPRFPSLSIFKEAWPSSMALRWNFENSATYADAIKDLTKTRMVGATFFYDGRHENRRSLCDRAHRPLRRGPPDAGRQHRPGQPLHLRCEHALQRQNERRAACVF